MSLFRCLHCGAHSARPFLSDCRDLYSGHPGSFDYAECEGCGLVQIVSIPADLSSYYGGYQVHEKKSRLHDIVRRRLMREAYFPHLGTGGGSMLDYGCGDGWFLEEARKHGWRLCGYELDASHASLLASSLGLPVFDSLETLAAGQPDSGFDVITLHFVFEHLSDPSGAFRKLAALLKPAGRMFITVPNILSWEFRLFGKQWHGLDAPRHISFHRDEHFQKLAADAGLKILSARDIAVPNCLAGSLATVGRRRFSYPLFVLAMPISVPLCRIGPTANRSYLFTKPE